MTQWIAGRIHVLGKTTPIIAEICYAGDSLDKMRKWLGAEFKYHPQGEGDLGKRMRRVAERARREDVFRLVMVGADIPGINEKILRQAFELLNRYDLVLGPARDGGYYLMGLNLTAEPEKWKPLFAGIDWGSDKVLDQTVAAAKTLDLNTAFTKELQDVDRPQDISVWRKIYQKRPLTHARISIMIPTLNEERRIGQTLAVAQIVDDIELIVADGGSDDRTTAIADALGSVVLDCPPLRAYQMNQAAQNATGNIFCFLHADTILPKKYAYWIRRTLAHPGVSAGAFSFGTDVDTAALKRMAAGVNWRSKAFELPYGDQALFVKRNVFEAAGGYPDLPIMEDVALVLNLREKGKIVTVPEAVNTSARRWKRLGAMKTTLINQAMLAAYFAKVSPNTLARWYRRK